MAHEIHQYYFEKYLRNEMSIKDKLTFEEKLIIDNQVRSSFEHYKLNRQQYLSDYAIREQKKTFSRKLNSWIYLLISLIGILLSINFYLDNQELKSLRANNSAESLPFYKRIPFFFGRNTEKKPNNTTKQKTEVVSDSTSVNTDSLTTTTDEETLSFDQDELLKDTFMKLYDRNVFEQHFETIRVDADSIDADSALENLTLKHLDSPTEGKITSIPVEFWRSPIGYVGYKCNGKKLVIFGYESPFKLTLLKYNNEIGIRQDEGNIYPLVTDNNFHKF